jgi:hypothetical protein
MPGERTSCSLFNLTGNQFQRKTYNKVREPKQGKYEKRFQCSNNHFAAGSADLANAYNRYEMNP